MKIKKEAKPKVKNLCFSCVKAIKNEYGLPVRCMALVEMIGKKGKCFAYSNDEFFWEKYNKEYEEYKRRKGVI